MNATRDRVADLIRRAFQGVQLGDGIGLWEGQALDVYSDTQGVASARTRDERNDWRAIPIDELCACESSLAFGDAEGARFLLPAFLIAELNDELTVGLLYNLTNVYPQDARFAALSPVQRSAVREFLLFLRDEPDYEYDRQDIDYALSTYWKP